MTTTTMHPLEAAVQQRLDALPEGFGSPDFRAAMLAQATAQVPIALLEEAVAASKAATLAAVERIDIPTAIEQAGTVIAGERLLSLLPPPVVDMSGVDRDVNEAAAKVAQLAADLELPELTYLREVARFEEVASYASPSRQLLPVPKSTDADLKAIAAMDALRPELQAFLADVRRYPKSRTEVDPIQALAIAAHLCQRRRDFDGPLAEIVSLVEAANNSPYRKDK